MISISDPRLMEFTIENIREYGNSSCSFSFIPFQKVYDDVDSDSSVSRIEGSLYDSKVVAISGINASGKTSLLSLIELMLEIYICNQELNEEHIHGVLDRFYDDKPMNIKVLYSSNGNILRINSTIERSQGRYFFNEEIIYRYNKQIFTKKNISDDSNYIEIMRRSRLSNEQKSFLESDKSISYVTINKSDTSKIFSYQEKQYPDYWEICLAADVIIPYLDSSIERIEAMKENLYVVHRKGRSSEELSYMELIGSLSSGTLRGIAFFARLLTVLKYGGYLLVDEIEDHFNKTIVVNILEFFMRKRTNPNGAHIVFTTHYQELLDILPRNDSVYITTRDSDGSLAVKNLAEFLKRRDVKRSDLLFSNFHDLGTAVEYRSEISLMQKIESLVNDKVNAVF